MRAPEGWTEGDGLPEPGADMACAELRNLAPEFVLPEQWATTPACGIGPEYRALMVALLVLTSQDATRAHRQVTGGRMGLRTALALGSAARAWFADDSRDWFLSFRSICDTLNLPAGVLRRAVLEQHRPIRARRQTTKVTPTCDYVYPHRRPGPPAGRLRRRRRRRDRGSGAAAGVPRRPGRRDAA